MNPSRTIAVWTLGLLFAAPALGQSEEDPGSAPAEGAEGAGEGPEVLPPEARAEAMPTGTISSRELDWLEPKRSHLDQNPYGSTDFTAYTLEFGETRIGLGSVTVGVVPRTQLGFSPPLLAMGIYNANLKVNLVRVGPVDFGLMGAHYELPIGDFRGRQTNVGAMVSTRVRPKWSVHVTGTYNQFAAMGMPDFSDPPALLSLVAPDLASYSAQASALTGGQPLDTTARSFTTKVATDWRFNRRDSLVLQAQAMVWSEVQSEIDPDALPPLMNLDKALSGSGDAPVAESYVASLAWQFSWKRADLRIGAGVSSVPGAWLLQSTELAWRFGGKTRSGERRMRATWRQNVDDLSQSEKAEKREGRGAGADAGMVAR